MQLLLLPMLLPLPMLLLLLQENLEKINSIDFIYHL
jgi:hypothetical protein